MESRKLTFDSQLYLRTQAPIVIRYLNQVAEQYSNICELFDSPEKRLFFKSFSDENLDEINSVFNKKELLDDFKKRLVYWRPQLNDISIASVRQLIRDFYFQPIKIHPQWLVFISKQKQLIEPQLKQKSNLELKLISLEEQLSGAFSFRIISAFLDKNPGFLTEKADLLAKILNVPLSTNALIVQFEDKIKNSITGEISFIISKGDPKELLTSIEKFHCSLLFRAIEFGPVFLWNIFEECLNESIKNDKEKTKFRKTAVDYLFSKLIDGDYSPSVNEILFNLISLHIDSAKKKKHADFFAEKSKSVSDSDLLKKWDAAQSKERLFFSSQRKLSSPPPLQKQPLLSPSSEQNESSTSPRSESQPSVIRPSRIGQMRRRASVASLATPRTSSEEKSSDTPRESVELKK